MDNSNTVMDTSCIEGGHIPVNHLLRQKAAKQVEPAASKATKRSGKEELDGCHVQDPTGSWTGTYRILYRILQDPTGSYRILLGSYRILLGSYRNLHRIL